VKLSVSLPSDDVEFLDYYITSRDLESRSAALQAAIRALRDLDLQDQYEYAFSDEGRREDPAVLEKWRQMAEAAQERKRRARDASR
jgi:Arc/MetJ-type ribon-helix-helix transcriptional regulator